MSFTSKARLFILAIGCLASTAWAAKPIISKQPGTYRTFSGETVRLKLTVDNAFTSVRWTRNGVEVPNQSSLTLAIPRATPENSGTYVARVTNAEGFTNSANIQVTVAAGQAPLGPWEPELPLTIPFRVSALNYLDGQFVAGTDQGTIHLSADGLSWTKAEVEAESSGVFINGMPILSVVKHGARYYAFANLRFVGEAITGGWVSDDLTHWQFDPTLPRVRQAVSDGQRIVVMRAFPNGSYALSRSVDGKVWEDIPSSSPVTQPDSITAFQGGFVCHYGNSGSSLRVFHSPDGFAWTNITSSLPAGFAIWATRGFPEYNGHLVNVAEGKVWKSANGINWTEVPVNPVNGISPFNNRSIQRMVAGLGRFWATDFNGNALVSENLSDWQVLNSRENLARASQPAAGSPTAVVAGMDAAGVALTRSATENVALAQAESTPGIEKLTATPAGIYAHRGSIRPASLSLDGNQWTTTSSNLRHVAYGNGVFAGRTNGSLLSFDGKNWTSITSNATGNSSLVFGNGRFVDLSTTASEACETRWSTDAVTWSARQSMNVGADSLVFSVGRFWALSQTWDQVGTSSYVYRYATSPDGETWTIKSVTLPSRPPLSWNVTDLVEIGGRIIISTSDPSWWLTSDNDGATWSRLDTGYGYLATTEGGVVIHQGWLVAPCASGDILLSSDGRQFHRIDGPAGAGGVAEFQGNLFIAHGAPSLSFTTILGVMRSGAAKVQPAVQVFGLAQGVQPERGEATPIGVVVTDHQPGDRIEFRINGVLVHSSEAFFTHYSWTPSIFVQETLVMTVIRADGTRSSQSWATGAIPAVATSITTAGLPPATRMGFLKQAGDRFYHVTPEGIVRHSADLLNWTTEILPDPGIIPSSNSFWLTVVVREDGARLLAVSEQTWVSAPGSNVWTKAEKFMRSANGRMALHFATGSLFTSLHPVDTSNYRIKTSTDGLVWAEGELFNPGAQLSLSASNNQSALVIVPAHFENGNIVPARLWRVTAGAFTPYFPVPGFEASWVYFGGKWVVEGKVAGVIKLLISDDGENWTEAVQPYPTQATSQIEVYGNGTWITRGREGILFTQDFQSWSLLPAAPSIPVWAAGRWVNRDPEGYGPVDHYESPDLTSWNYVSTVWPKTDNAILTVTGGKLLSTLGGRGLYAMDATGKWEILTWWRDASHCIFWKGKWIYASKQNPIALVRPGGDLRQLVMNAPVPASSSAQEVALGFIDAGEELLMYSNRSLYATADGVTWERRPTPADRSVRHVARIGSRLVLDTTSSLATVHRSEDGGRSWIPVTLPSGGVNYNNVPFSPTGLMVEDGTIHAVLTSSQRLSSPDGIAWTLLPATTNVSFPWPVKLPAGSAIWATAATNGQQWQLVQTPPVANIPLTQPIFATTPPPQYFRGRFIQLSSAGVRTTPLANLTLSFPDQAGHTAKAGETFPVDVEIRNTGFDNAWLDIPVKIELRVEGNEASAGSIELGTSIAIGEVLRKTVQVTVPANTGGGRYHLIASLVEDGGLPVDSIADDNVATSAETLLRVSGSSVRVAATGGGQLLLLDPSGGVLPLGSSASVTRGIQAVVRAVPDQGKRFTGWSDPAAGNRQEFSVDQAAGSQVMAYFATGSASYESWSPSPGPENDDADGDGCPNVLEFLLAADPFTATSRGWPLVGTSLDGRPYLEFTEARGIQSHWLTARYSADVEQWDEIAREQWELVKEDATSCTWRIYSLPGDRGFFRLDSETSAAP